MGIALHSSKGRMTRLDLVLVGGLLLLHRAACQTEPDEPGWMKDTFDAKMCPIVLGNYGLNNPNFFATERDEAVFWSTAVDHKQGEPNVNLETAQAWAFANGKKTLEMTDGGMELVGWGLWQDDNTNAENGDAAYAWNCASLFFAQRVSGSIHAFSSQRRVHTPYNENGRPTFYNIELPNILRQNASAEIVFHYNFNNGNDVWCNGCHCAGCTDWIEQGYTVSAQRVYEEYGLPNDANPPRIPYPDYGKDDGLRTCDCLNVMNCECSSIF